MKIKKNNSYQKLIDFLFFYIIVFICIVLAELVFWGRSGARLVPGTSNFFDFDYIISNVKKYLLVALLFSGLIFWVLRKK